jgi:hypothetical protein
VLFSNSPSEQVFRERFSPIYECGETIMEQVECMPYPKVNTIVNDFATFGDRKALLGAQITHLNIKSIREVYNSYVKFTDENPTASQTFIAYDLYSEEKYCSVPTNSTAYYARKPCYNAVINQRWTNEQDDKIIYNWAKSVQKIINKDGYEDKSIYINLESTMDVNHYNEVKMGELFGENLEKLKELKRKYDPNVFFRKGAVIWP